MKKILISLILAISISGCSNNNNSDSTPIIQPKPIPQVPVEKDMCTNYEGIQTQKVITDNNIQVVDGVCSSLYNNPELDFSKANWAKVNGYSGSGQTVAVLDSCSMLSHVELSNDPVIVGINFWDKNTDIECGKGDYEHGLRIDSLIAGKYMGTAPQTKVYHDEIGAVAPIEYMLAEGVKDIITNNYKVINISNEWSNIFITYNPVNDPYKLIDLIKQNDVIIVFASGNRSKNYSDDLINNNDYLFTDNTNSPHYIFAEDYDVTNKTLFKGTSYPGWKPEVYSRFITVNGSNLTLPAKDGSYNTPVAETSGTSYSAPQVTAAIAILKSIDQNLTAPQAAQILLDTADRSDPLYSQTCTDNAHTVNCGNMYYGMGFINIKAAIQYTKMR